MNPINLTPVFQALIALLAALITYKVIPWLKSRTTISQRQDLATAARIAVFAAEQLYGRSKEANEIKLDYAIGRLREAGFDLDALALREAVEAAVYEFKSETFPRFIDFHGSGQPEDEDVPDLGAGGDAEEEE